MERDKRFERVMDYLERLEKHGKEAVMLLREMSGGVIISEEKRPDVEYGGGVPFTSSPTGGAEQRSPTARVFPTMDIHTADLILGDIGVPRYRPGKKMRTIHECIVYAQECVEFAEKYRDRYHGLKPHEIRLALQNEILNILGVPQYASVAEREPLSLDERMERGASLVTNSLASYSEKPAVEISPKPPFGYEVRVDRLRVKVAELRYPSTIKAIVERIDMAVEDALQRARVGKSKTGTGSGV